jgi:hypothetical protein
MLAPQAIEPTTGPETVIFTCQLLTRQYAAIASKFVKAGLCQKFPCEGGNLHLFSGLLGSSLPGSKKGARTRGIGFR